eukprot:1720789-Pyramimonas_sp.AAC.4
MSSQRTPSHPELSQVGGEPCHQRSRRLGAKSQPCPATSNTAGHGGWKRAAVCTVRAPFCGASEEHGEIDAD